jgi:hypothetical protein
LCCSQRESSDTPRRLIAITGTFGAWRFYVLFATLSRFLRMRGRFGLVTRTFGRPSVVAWPIGAGRSHIFLAAFGGLLGMFWTLLAHPALLRAPSVHCFIPSERRVNTSTVREATHHHRSSHDAAPGVVRVREDAAQGCPFRQLEVGQVAAALYEI